MSEAPRVELPNTGLDFDLAATANQYQQTGRNPMQRMQQPNGNQFQQPNGSQFQQLNGNQFQQPNGNQFQQPNGNSAQNLQNSAARAKDSILDTATHAMSAANNHPAVQNAKDTVLNGPVGQNVQAQGAKTRNEFADLANSRTVPDHKAATGQNLTHYHSMFYRLLSWKNPRATGIAFALTVIFIFAARYLNLIRYMFKGSYMTLGATAAAEVIGQLAFGRGLTSQFRPRQYYTIPKASLERMTDDVEQLINFFVIESQRVVFAENVYVTVAAFFASLISYFLIKFVPLWGLALIATVVTYLGPLIYISNKEVIDAQLEKGYNIANQQATQVKNLANQHAGNAVKTVQGYTQQATAKAQETVNQYRGRSTSPEVQSKNPNLPSVPKRDFSSASQQDSTAAPRRDFSSTSQQGFPVAPRHNPAAESSSEEEEEATEFRPLAQPAM